MKTRKYEITKEFKRGSLLYPLRITELTSVHFEPGFETDDYTIIAVREVLI